MAKLRELSPAERLAVATGNREHDLALLREHPPLDLAEAMIENAIGYLSLPIGLAEHFVIDGVPWLIPMAIEETSVIASASGGAKWLARCEGELTTECRGRDIMVQIHLPEPRRLSRSLALIEDQRGRIIEEANLSVRGLVRRGGGFHRLEVRVIADPRGGAFAASLSVELYCDPRDAMGANLVTQAGESLKPRLAELTGERVGMAIVSNLGDGALFVARARLPRAESGVARAIAEGSRFAEADPHRAATHNKGIFNGVDALLIATGNDWRASEASGHAYASLSGRYLPLSRWQFVEGDGLFGELIIPLQLGTVGGAARIHPVARACREILGTDDARTLGRICAGVGLIQNLAALRALTGTGVSKGHMALHASNLAWEAGADDADQREEIRRELARRARDGRPISQTDAIEVRNALPRGRRLISGQ